MNAPTASDVHAARQRIVRHIKRTTSLRSTALDEATGGVIMLKPEVLQRTGSFKIRGAINAVALLNPAQRQRGAVTFSSGNHGQALACAGHVLDTAVTVLMPADAPPLKRELTTRWGCRIIDYDRFADDREAMALHIAETTGATFIAPYDHPDVIAGQGTVALEMVGDAHAAGLELDAVLICTGGGGLTAGCALALADISPNTKIYAVEPAGWNDTARSLIAGKRLHNDMTGSTFCDALLTQTPGELTFSINRHLLTGGLTVTESQIKDAMIFAARHLKLILEPSGAVALAAVLSGAFNARHLTVGVILSGGNIDPLMLGMVLAGR